MVGAVAVRLIFCVVGLGVIGLSRLGVLGAMRFDSVLRGFRRGHGYRRACPHRWKGRQRKGQTRDKGGPEPTHDTQHYVTGAPRVK